MTNYYVGIDYSLSCPAIAIQGDDPSFDKTLFHYMDRRDKMVGSYRSNIYGSAFPSWKTAQERYAGIANWVWDKIWRHRPHDNHTPSTYKIFIEDYSMASKGKVFHIGEHGGVLRHILWENGIEFETIPPTAIKSSFTGKGNADKVAMLAELKRREGIDLKALLGPDRQQGSPEEDVCDAYAIVLTGRRLHHPNASFKKWS